MIGTQGEHIEGAEIVARIRHLAEEQHPVADTQLAGLSLEVFLQAPLAENHQLAVGRQLRQCLGETIEQSGLVLVRMQASDVADNPGIRRQPEGFPGLASRHLRGLQGIDVDAVVQRLNSRSRPLRQATAHVVAHRVGHTEQAQTLAEYMGEQFAAAALVVFKPVVHTNDRQRRTEQGDIDRLEAMSDAETEVARRGDLAQIADGTQLQATNGLGAVLHEQHFVGGAARGDFGIGNPGEKHRGHSITGPREQAGVLPCAVQERPVIAVAELQHMTFSRTCHRRLRPL
ncbi:hypothetical protein D3C86_1368600 [compost metagenome]